jgi:hypothetical protein
MQGKITEQRKETQYRGGAAVGRIIGCAALGLPLIDVDAAEAEEEEEELEEEEEVGDAAGTCVIEERGRVSSISTELEGASPAAMRFASSAAITRLHTCRRGDGQERASVTTFLRVLLTHMRADTAHTLAPAL